MVLLGMGGIQALFAYVFTDNLSTAMIILGITVGLVFIAHPKTKPFVILAVVAVILVAILVLQSFSYGFRALTSVYVVFRYGFIRRIMQAEMAIRPCRLCMQLVQEVSLAEVLETVSRSLEVCLRHRMT